MFHGFETFRIVLSKLFFAAAATVAISVLMPETASAQCSIILCATHEINLPVVITNSSASPAMTVMGGNVGIGTLSPSAGLDVALTGASSAILVPRDTTANRPSALAGMIRYNTTDSKFEFYEGSTWKNLGSGGGGGGSSQWADVSGGISYTAGSVGVGIATPGTLFHVSSPETGDHSPVVTLAPSLASGNAVYQLLGRSANTDEAGFIGYGYDATLANRILGFGHFGGNFALAIANSGNVGVGTISPDSPLHVSTDSDSASTVHIVNTSTGTSALTEINMENGAYSFGMGMGSVNYSDLRLKSRAYQFSYGPGLSLVSEFSTDVADMRFLTGATPAVERMRITGTGDVGIGTGSPAEKLHVVGNLRVQGTSADCIMGTGAGGASCVSDISFKDNVKPIASALEKISKVRGVEFTWNEKSQSPGRKDIGVIAQEIEAVFPTSVIVNENGKRMVDYASLVAPLIEAVKELKQQVQEQQLEISTLKAELQKQ